MLLPYFAAVIVELLQRMVDFHFLLPESCSPICGELDTETEYEDRLIGGFSTDITQAPWHVGLLVSIKSLEHLMRFNVVDQF